MDSDQGYVDSMREAEVSRAELEMALERYQRAQHNVRAYEVTLRGGAYLAEEVAAVMGRNSDYVRVMAPRVQA